MNCSTLLSVTTLKGHHLGCNIFHLPECNYNTVLIPRQVPHMAIKINKDNIEKFATYKQTHDAYYISAPWAK